MRRALYHFDLNTDNSGAGKKTQTSLALPGVTVIMPNLVPPILAKTAIWKCLMAAFDYVSSALRTIRLEAEAVTALNARIDAPLEFAVLRFQIDKIHRTALP